MARKSKRLNNTMQKPSVPMPVYSVAIYLRISNEENEKNVGTIEFQKQIALEYIKNKNDMVLYEIYIDDGKTGTNFDREGFQEMMYAIYNGKVNCIIVKDLSRFGREYIEMGDYVEKIFSLLGVRFIAINDSVDNMVHPNDVSVPIKNVINALYAKDISRKISSTFRMKQLNGEYIGGFGPYGYICSEDKSKLVIDPEAAEVVRKIFKWKLDGLGTTIICRMLVNEGISPPGKYKYEKGIFKSEKYANMKYWSPSAVSKILSNEMYIGNMVQGKTKRSLYNNLPFKNVDKENWIIVENTHEPIISKEDFYAVQDMLENAAHKPRVRQTHKKENMFKRKVFCGDCGHSMARMVANGKNTSNYFACRHHLLYPDYCSAMPIREDVLKSIVHQSIKVQISTLTHIEKSIKAAVCSPEVKKIMYSLTKEISDTLSNIAYIKENRINIAKDFAKQILTEEEYGILRSRFDAELLTAAEKLETLEKKRCKFNRLFTADKWIDELKQHSSAKKLNASMIDTFVKKVKVYSDKRVEIEWKHKDVIEEYLELACGGERIAG